MIRRWQSTVLAFVLLGAVFALLSYLPKVGIVSRSGDKQIVSVWGWNIAAMSLDSLAPGFEVENPGVDIVITRSGANMQSRFLLSLASGVGAPSISQLQEREAAKFTPSGRLYDLTEHAAKYKDQFPPVFWESCQYQGRTVALPWDMGPCAVFYKRWIFEKYDIDPEDIKTWGDFIEAGQSIVRASDGKTHMMPLSVGSLADTYQILMQQSGGGIFDKQGRIMIQHPNNRRALEILRALLDSGITTPIEGPEYFASIGTDSVACYPMAVWFMQSIKDYAAGTEGRWGVFRLPAYHAGGLRASNLGGSVLVIPDQGIDKDLAWLFIEFTNCRVESQVAQYRDFGLFPAYLPALEDPYFDEPDPFFGGQRVHRLFTKDIKRIPAMTRTEDWNEAERYLAQTLSTWETSNLGHDVYLRQAAEALSRKLGREIITGPYERATD